MARLVDAPGAVAKCAAGRADRVWHFGFSVRLVRHRYPDGTPTVSALPGIFPKFLILK